MISTMASIRIKGHNSAGQKEKDRVSDSVYSALRYQEDGFCRFVDLMVCGSATARETQIYELTEICDRIAWDEQARVVVFRLEESIPGGDECVDSKQASLAAPVSRLKQPLIAAIEGNAAGAGLELALACDIRIAGEASRFSFPQIQTGRIPSNGGTQKLPRLIGLTKSMEMILTGEWIDAVEARRIGLIHRIVPPDSVMNAAIHLAREIAEKSPLALSYAKEALYSAGDLTLDQGLNKELDLYLLLFSTTDRTEGLTAFVEKRKPQFEGK
jgi:enoyl-CoA hydratase/carnithine racemase